MSTTENDRRPIKRALVSVYDKTGLVEVGLALAGSGVEIVSTGSTARTLAEAGVPVTQVEQLTGFPECLDGRVKTLHPFVHAGLLADTRLESHRAQLAELGIAPFDLLVSNLYPFVDTVMAGAGQEETIEQIDIGGPVDGPRRGEEPRLRRGGHLARPVRAAAGRPRPRRVHPRRAPGAGRGRVRAHGDVRHRGRVLDGQRGDRHQRRQRLPALGRGSWDKAAVLRYGENPHQRAALYVDGAFPGGLATAQQLHGKEMSYNNYVDTDAARRAAYDFDAPAVAIIKHANPCGIAVGADIAEAHAEAHACDPVSAFGGVIATNRPVSVAMAQQVAEVFTEVIAAPAYEDGAVEVLQAKKNIRILVVEPADRGGIETRGISGGLLMQAVDTVDAEHDPPRGWELVSGEPATPERLADLEFAWRACRAVKSNAILLANDGASVGVGMGQVNRVDSCRLAVERAGERARGRWPPRTRSSRSPTARRS